MTQEVYVDADDGEAGAASTRRAAEPTPGELDSMIENYMMKHCWENLAVTILL